MPELLESQSARHAHRQYGLLRLRRRRFSRLFSHAAKNNRSESSTIAQTIEVVQSYTSETVTNATILPHLALDSVGALALTQSFQMLWPSVNSHIITQEITLGQLVQQMEGRVCESSGPHVHADMQTSRTDAASALNVIVAFYVLALHYLPVEGLQDPTSKPTWLVFRFFGEALINYFIMSSGFFSQMYAPLHISQPSFYAHFLGRRILSFFPTFVISMGVCTVLGDAWYLAGTGSTKFLFLCFSTIRWYIVPHDKIDGVTYCPNTVSWTLGTLLFWWVLFPLIQFLLVSLEAVFGVGILPAMVTMLLVTLLQPSVVPFAFPIGYGSAFVCGVVAARHLKRMPEHTRRDVVHPFLKRPSTAFACTPGMRADGCIALSVCMLFLQDSIRSWIGIDSRNLVTPLLAAFLHANASGKPGVAASFLNNRVFSLVSHCTLEVFLFQVPFHRVLTRSFNLPDWYVRFVPLGYNPERTVPFVTYTVCLWFVCSFYATHVREPMTRLVVNAALCRVHGNLA